VGIFLYRGTVGETGDLLAGTLREKMKVYLGSILEPRGGPSGTLIKGLGSSELISDYGAQMAHL
jgi:hypothetical protein